MARRDRGDLSAAAAIVDPGDYKLLNQIKGEKQKWQESAWKHYDALPEVHYPANFLGHNLQRFELRIGQKVVRDGELHIEESDDAAAWEALDALDEGDGIPELNRLFAVNWTVSADLWLIGQDEGGTTNWRIYSVNEVDIRDDMTDHPTIYIDGERLPSTAFARRIWNRHANKRIKADGAMNSLDGPCLQLEKLYDAISAQIDSRLASAGLLFLPNTIQIPGAITKPSGTNQPQDPLLVSLANSMMKGIQERGTAAGRVPIFLRGPAEAGDKIKHILLDRLINEQEMKLRSELRATIMQGMDLPPEVQGSMSEMNHWSTWTVQDSSFRSHLKPVGDTWGSALSSTYLQPYLKAAGVADDVRRKLLVIADGSALVVRPNEVEDRRQLWDRGGLSLRALRDGSGITEDHRMDDAEYIRWIGIQTGDPYLATLGLPGAKEIDWTQVNPTGGKSGPKGNDTPERPKVNGSTSTAGRPGGGAGGKEAAGGVKSNGRT